MKLKTTSLYDDPNQKGTIYVAFSCESDSQKGSLKISLFYNPEIFMMPDWPLYDLEGRVLSYNYDGMTLEDLKSWFQEWTNSWLNVINERGYYPFSSFLVQVEEIQ